MADIKSMVWQEKYRPSNVVNVISVHTPKIIKQLENPMEMQNFLFHSRTGGTGKTSMARAIITDLKCDFLALNASKDRSIDMIRSKVNDFCVSQTSNPNTKKCVWMDEGEKLSKDAMDALKNMIETYASNAFFVMTTNNIDKINQPMQSRFNVMEFSRPKKEHVEHYLREICEAEKIPFMDDAIELIVNMHYPSIRKMINALQDLHLDGRRVEKQNIIKGTESHETLWKLVCEKKFTDAKKTIIIDAIDCLDFNKYVFNIACNSDIPVKQQIKLIQLCAKNERDFKMGADATIVMLATIPEMMLAMGEK